MSKIITNPTEEKIAVSFRGRDYECDAKETVKVDDDVAFFWKRMHGFISVGEVEQKAAPTEEEKTVEVKEVVDEEPKVKAKVKAKVSKKAKK